MEPTFRAVPERPNFPKEEEGIVQFWKEIDAFQESLRQSLGKPEFTFYDGPPFATGLPHYGHILAGTIKDVITRHFHQRGFHVDRRFGWDCHGVPVEGIIDKKLNIRGRADVLEMGMDKYNEECRSVVQMYTSEWRQIIERYGRWIDFDNDYKTMDINFMESIWWVFRQLFDKGMVYRAHRVIAYSTVMATSLSNFEAALNYKEVSDPSVIVQFKRLDKDDAWILAWTTTPWTLPSNLALCVHPTLTYLRVKKKEDNQEWIVGKDRWQWVCSSIKKGPDDFEVLEELPGEKLVGIPYEPLFDYFKGKALDGKAWHIVSDKYVTTAAGTCIVHQAPAFGDDDNRVCKKFGVITKDGTGMVDPVDGSGCFTSEVPDFVGQHVKEADKGIKDMLKKKGHLVFNGTEIHNYPHCWRSDTPLIYKAVPAWYVNVEDAKERLLACNQQTYWIPAFVKEKRFHNWLSEARDWNISRSRYWGTPIPLWVSDDFEEIVCIGSVAELEEHAGRKITDIHRHFIDDITIPSKQGKGVLRRVDEVFDCWFESGSMPYGQKHYPFENKEEFEAAFPANFIAEGLDQTRGWFYSLMVLSTLVFDKPCWKNLIVNGLVLAADGKKMSKRLQNYPDPVEMCNKYGADAVRMYMCNSPVVRAEPLKFKEDGVKDVVKDVFLSWFNAYRFLVQEATRFENDGVRFRPDGDRVKNSSNSMDKWIIAATHELIKFVRQEMDAYRLYTVVGGLTHLLEDLTNWYIRLNRDRMKGDNGPEEALTSLCTVYEVLLNVTVMLAPVTPFITEFMYQNLSRALPEGHTMKAQSVHFVMVPDFDSGALDPSIQTAVQRMQSVVELGRTCREQRKVGLKTPLQNMTIIHPSDDYLKDIQSLQSYVQDELNVVEITYKTDMSNIGLALTLNFPVLGKRLGKDMKAVKAAVDELSQESITSFEREGSIVVCGHELTKDEMSVARKVLDLKDANLHAHGDSETMVIMDFTFDEGLAQLAVCRDIANRVNKLRKDAKLQQDDFVDVWAEVADCKDNSKLNTILVKRAEYINKQLRKPLWKNSMRQGHENLVKEDVFDIQGEKLRTVITWRSAFFNEEKIAELVGESGSAREAIRQHFATYSVEQLADINENLTELNVSCEEKNYTVVPQVHFSFGPGTAAWLKN